METSTMKIVTILGARPQFVKAASLTRAIASSNKISEALIHTGQHYDANMSAVFFDELDIKQPAYNLNITGASPSDFTAKAIMALSEKIRDESPDIVLVYGDTNTTLAAAIASVQNSVPLAHIEAGLRSYRKFMPEEINRTVTDTLADYLFTPSRKSVDNLLREGKEKRNIYNVGDIMFDTVLYYSDKAKKPQAHETLIDKFALCTIHRAENTDSPEVLHALLIGLEKSRIPIVLPLHPRTRRALEKYRMSFPNNVNCIDPTSYFETLWLLKNCSLVITDSGGLQKEAYYFGKYCATLRDETEWEELVERGYNFLCGNSDSNKIASNLTRAYQQSPNAMADRSIYGEGNTAKSIVDILENL